MCGSDFGAGGSCVCGAAAEPRAVPAGHGGAAPACAGVSLRAILCKQQCSGLAGAARLPKAGSGLFPIPVFVASSVMQRPVWGVCGGVPGQPREAERVSRAAVNPPFSLPQLFPQEISKAGVTKSLRISPQPAGPGRAGGTPGSLWGRVVGTRGVRALGDGSPAPADPRPAARSLSGSIAGRCSEQPRARAGPRRGSRGRARPPQPGGAGGAPAAARGSSAAAAGPHVERAGLGAGLGAALGAALGAGLGSAPAGGQRRRPLAD